jgi:hypothetical protein
VDLQLSGQSLARRVCGPLVLHKSSPKSSDTNYARPTSNCTKKTLPFVGVGVEHTSRGRGRNRRRKTRFRCAAWIYHPQPNLDTAEGGLLRRVNRRYSTNLSSKRASSIAVLGVISTNQTEQTNASRVYQSGAVGVAPPRHRGLDSVTKIQIGPRVPRSSSYVLGRMF